MRGRGDDVQRPASHGETRGSVKPVHAAILIVDDDEAILAALEGIVMAHFPDVRITLASDSTNALRHLEEGKFDVVISDYRLRAGMDGAGLLQLAAQLQPWAARLALTADPDQYVIEMGRKARFTLLTKPIEETILLRILGKRLRK
jgi:DNA-binding NtrC family response regulator